MIAVSEAVRVSEALRESEARLQALLSSLDDLVFELDETGTYLGVWTTDDTLLAAPRMELLGRNVRDAIDADVALDLIQVIRRVLDTGCPELWEYRLEVPAGYRWFQGRVAAITPPRGGASGRICLLVRDVTIQKMAEEEISRSLSREQLLSRLSEALPVGLFQIATAGRVIFTNHLLHTIVGHAPASTIKAELSSVVAEDRSAVGAALAAVLAGQPVDDIEVRFRLSASDPLVGDAARVCLLSLRTLTDGEGTVTGAVGCLSDITERVQLRTELEVRASVDPLTSCMNRAASLELLRRTIAAPSATTEGRALIFIDLDRFKSVNDRYGHAAGDRLLVDVADRLRGAVRGCDHVGRLGGDEFLVICPRVHSSRQAIAIAERLAAATTAEVDVGPAVVALRTSIGVAWTNEVLDADSFIAQADSAMYESKRTGRKGVSLFISAGGDGAPAPAQ
ncbi:MAG: diguanylate cyclase [Acidimicrobiales bacterium]